MAKRPATDGAPRPLAPTVTAAYRDAVDVADSYRAVRTAVRLDRGILRVGNRFVPLDRYREIAFVALGNASASLALGLWETLGERLTQGIVAGATPTPSNVPFRSWVVPPGYPGGEVGISVAASVEELSRGLGPRDLLILLLSPGGLSALSTPPAGVTGPEWQRLLAGMAHASAGGGELTGFVRCFGGGVAGGRLGRVATAGEIETLLLDRGDGPANVAGGPTIPLLPAEAASARALLQRHASLPEMVPRVAELRRPPPPEEPLQRAGMHRPVVLLGPADALRGASDAFADRRWVCRLGGMTIPGPPEAAAERLLARAEELVAELRWTPHGGADPAGAAPRSEARVGAAIFAGVTLGLPEGIEETEATDRFLRSAQRGLTRRGSAVILLPTAGATVPGRGPPGGYVEAEGPPGTIVRSLPMRAGLTDVGPVAIAAYRAEG